MVKLLAFSKERYNGGIAVKRRYGSSTVTIFWVMKEEDRNNPGKWLEIKSYGKTPGERKTFALNEARKIMGIPNGS